VLVVSHDARLVPYADRVFHLDDGHLTEQTAEVFPLRHAEELPAAV
jgi:ABC-type lipoprotein export system ATPase subunit